MRRCRKPLDEGLWRGGSRMWPALSSFSSSVRQAISLSWPRALRQFQRRHKSSLNGVRPRAGCAASRARISAISAPVTSRPCRTMPSVMAPRVRQPAQPSPVQKTNFFRLRFGGGRLPCCEVGLAGANSLRDSQTAGGTLSSRVNAVNGYPQGVQVHALQGGPTRRTSSSKDRETVAFPQERCGSLVPPAPRTWREGDEA